MGLFAGSRDKFWCIQFHPQLDVLAKTAKGKFCTNVLTNENFPSILNFQNRSIQLDKFSQQISSLCNRKPFACKYKAQFALTSEQTRDLILRNIFLTIISLHFIQNAMQVLQYPKTVILHRRDGK